MQSLPPQTNSAHRPSTEAELSQEFAEELGRYTRPLAAMRLKLAFGLPVLASMPADLRHAAHCLNGLAIELEHVCRAKQS
jgi:hypothetical protein